MAKEELKSPQHRTLAKRLVRELCNTAGVNRTTFYNHYDGVYEVLGEIEENFLSQLADEDGFTHGQLDLPQHIERLCAKLQQNSSVALLLLTNNADPNFSAKLTKLQACGSVWSETISSYSPAEYELLAQFISGGAFSMICYWLENGCQQTPEQVAALMTKVIQKGILPKRYECTHLSMI